MENLSGLFSMLVPKKEVCEFCKERGIEKHKVQIDENVSAKVWFCENHLEDMNLGEGLFKPQYE